MRRLARVGHTAIRNGAGTTFSKVHFHRHWRFGVPGAHLWSHVAQQLGVPVLHFLSSMAFSWMVTFLTPTLSPFDVHHVYGRTECNRHAVSFVAFYWYVSRLRVLESLLYARSCYRKERAPRIEGFPGYVFLQTSVDDGSFSL